MEGLDRKALAATVASRYIVAVGRLPKQQLKRRYELAKAVLRQPQVPFRSWLLVIDNFPGWRKKMVDDPNGDKYQLVYDVTAPNGKNMLLYVKHFSKENDDEIDTWMRRETDVIEQLEQTVRDYEETPPEQKTPLRKNLRTPAALGVPIAKADFSRGKGDRDAGSREYETYRVDFGLRDERGRAVGFMVDIYEPNPVHYAPDKQKGWFCRVHPMRDGETFGAIRPEKAFDERKGAEAAARKAMMESFKRYSKLYPAKP